MMPKMQKSKLIWGVVQRMTFYGGITGVLLGLLYFWAGAIIPVLLGYVVGTITGIVEGLIMAALISFVLRPLAEVSRYRQVVGAINGALAAIVTSWFVYGILSAGGGSVEGWGPTVLVLFFVIPA